MTKFFVLWLILGTDKFPYSSHETLNDCNQAGIEYVTEYNPSMNFKCVEWSNEQ